MGYRLLLFLLLMLVSGCGPQLSEADLGMVLFEVPEVAGSDEPYEMPELGPPIKREDEPGDHPLPGRRDRLR